MVLVERKLWRISIRWIVSYISKKLIDGVGNL